MSVIRQNESFPDRRNSDTVLNVFSNTFPWRRLVGALAVLVALATGGLVLVTLTGTSEVCSVTAPAAGAVAETENAPVCTTYTTTLVEDNAWVVVPVFLPALISLGALSRRRGIRVGAAVLLTAFCVLTGFSIGMFFFPVAALAVACAVLDRPRLPPIPAARYAAPPN